jgi:hypothetical protein
MEKANPVARSDALSNRELALVADSLATAADEFADRSCNDFSFPFTPENRAIGEAIARHCDPGYWAADNTLVAFLAEMAANNERVVVYDNWAAGYFAELCRRLASTTPAGPLSAAELAIIAELLESSAEDHEGWYGDDRDDLDITLAPTAEHRDLLAAATLHQAPRGWRAKLAKLAQATGPISLPDFQLMRYMAARCKAHAAVTDAVSAAAILTAPAPARARDGTIRLAGAVPVIERAGIAPRFPQLKRYLKAYSQPFANWQTEQLPLLERYAAGEAGATLSQNGKFTTEFAYARGSLFECSLALGWHAVQTALGGAIAVAKEKKTKVSTLKATEREFAKLVEDGKHVHRQIPPALNARDFQKLLEPGFGGKYAEQVDAEISRAEFDIVRHLLLNNHAPEHIQQAFLALSPELAARKGEDAATYVADTMRRATDDPLLQQWREQHQSAGVDAASFQRAIGKDWLAPLRRSIAYEYWSCRMAAHCAGPWNYSFNNTVGTATDCLVLGWEEEALGLFRQVRAHIDEKRFNHINESRNPTQYFLLRLIADSQGKPRTGDGEPLFAALLTHWQTPDANALAPLLLAVCDRHTHQAAKTDGPVKLRHTYYPFEVLAVLRLRLQRGLTNPLLEHPLMSTPLGALPEVTEFYADELLEGVVKQARLEFQDL